MLKNHSDRERGNPLPLHRLLFSISSKVFLYASSHRQDNTHHGLCYTSRGALAGTRNSPMGSTMKDRSDDPSHHERTLLPRSYISLHPSDLEAVNTYKEDYTLVEPNYGAEIIILLVFI